MSNKTTKKDFKLFEKECLYWIDIFGLIDYEVAIDHKDYLERVRSCCFIDVVGRCSTIALSEDWEDNKITKKEIKRVAFYGALELLIVELFHYSRERFVTRDQIEAASHRIIRVLEKLLFNPYYEVKLEESKR